MENIELTTPSGYKVTLKPNLNYGEYTQIQEMMQAKATFDPINKTGTVPGSVVGEANRKALEFLLIKVINPDGTEASSPVDAINNMPARDGILVRDKIDELTSDDGVSKKKGI